MPKKNISEDRRKYLRKIAINKTIVIGTQIGIILIFILLWEILADKNIIDSFIMSQPSRILDTFMNLSSNGLLEHLGVTCLETVIGFSLGVVLGTIIAIILWWSKFLSKVAEPFLVVLNSLPKVALRASYNNLGRCRNASNYSNGSCNCDGNQMTTITREPANASNSTKKWFSLDAQALANLFSKIKQNENINEKIELKVDRVPTNISKPELKDFADQMIYFRKQLGYTQKQVGKAIGVSEDTYRRYELRKVEIIDLKKIDKIVKVLEFTEKPKLSEYVEFLMSSPEKILEKFFAKSKISKNAFAKRVGFNRRTILEWINKEKSISEKSYYKIKKFIEENQK